MNKIKNLREENGWTQLFLAEKMGISRQVLSNYENEINQPSPDVLIKFADIFQCSIDYLLGREDDFGVISLKNEKTAELTPDEQKHLTVYRKLNTYNRMKVASYAEIRLEEQGDGTEARRG